MRYFGATISIICIIYGLSLVVAFTGPFSIIIIGIIGGAVAGWIYEGKRIEEENRRHNNHHDNDNNHNL